MALYPVNEIRVHVIGLVLLGADVFVLLPAFANPFQLLYVYIVTPPVIFLICGRYGLLSILGNDSYNTLYFEEYMAPYVQSDYWL